VLRPVDALLPSDPEVAGLLALVRWPSRTGAAGTTR
jgi:hypothetical protein